MTNKHQSLDQLVRIYRYRQIVAQQRYNDQKEIVDKCLAELTEIMQAVVSLQQKSVANKEYRRDGKNNSDALKMVNALKYQSQIEYDLERENFYLSLAQDELVMQEVKLNNILAEIDKMSVKIESLAELKQKHIRAAEISDEVTREDDYLQTLKANGGAHG